MGLLAGKLLFGDGQARGLAVRLAFQFLVNLLCQSQDSLFGGPELMRIMEGLIQVPTVLTMSGESSTEDLIVAQAVRQNVKAAMQIAYNYHGMGCHGPQELQAQGGCVICADCHAHAGIASLHE
jgi:hypothetical protein